MNRKKVKKVNEELMRLALAIADLEGSDSYKNARTDEYPLDGSKLTSAVRRASLDLSAALVELRKTTPYPVSTQKVEGIVSSTSNTHVGLYYNPIPEKVEVGAASEPQEEKQKDPPQLEIKPLVKVVARSANFPKSSLAGAVGDVNDDDIPPPPAKKNRFLEVTKEKKPIPEKRKVGRPKGKKPVPQIFLSDLVMSVRLSGLLFDRLHFRSLNQVATLTRAQFAVVRGVGEKALKEADALLKENGLEWAKR